MQRVVRVNARTCAIEQTPISDEMSMWGGRQLIANVLACEVDPTCAPLGRGNKLIFAPGWFGGTTIPTSGRLSIGGKSPLTGGIKESNVGGEAGQTLARAGVRALIIEDAPDDPASRVLRIDRNDAAWVEDLPLDRCSVRETLGILRERFGERCGLLVLGPARDRLVTPAGFATTDATGMPLRNKTRSMLFSLCCE